MQFILKSTAFLLELGDDGLHQTFWHGGMLSPAFGIRMVSAEFDMALPEEVSDCGLI